MKECVEADPLAHFQVDALRCARVLRLSPALNTPECPYKFCDLALPLNGDGACGAMKRQGRVRPNVPRVLRLPVTMVCKGLHLQGG